MLPAVSTTFLQRRLATRQQVQDMRDGLAADVRALAALEEQVASLQQVGKTFTAHPTACLGRATVWQSVSWRSA